MAKTAVPQSPQKEAVTLVVDPAAKKEGDGSARRPFRSIPAALAATRRYRKSGRLVRPVTILLRGGNYFFDQPLVLKPSDSGSIRIDPKMLHLQIENNPLTLAAAPGETPVLSGGRKITGWREQTRGNLRVWTVALPEVKKGKWYFRQLWVNGERRARPRLPREGFFRIEKVPGLTAKTDWRKGQTRIIAREGDFTARKNITDVEVIALTKWIESRLPVTAYHPKTRAITFDRPSFYKLAEDTDEGALTGTEYYVENVGEALALPGEWYLDRADGVLTYCPLPGETFDNTEVIAPRLAQVLRLQGAPEKSRDAVLVDPEAPRKTPVMQPPYYIPSVASLRQPGERDGAVENIVFQGLKFAHTEWRYPAGIASSGQAAWAVPAAVALRYANRCVFRRCEFANLGNYALSLEDGCCTNDILHCTFRDLGAGGVKIWHGCRYNTLSDSTMSAGGRIYHSAVGVLVGRAGGNAILHNRISDFYYTGISIGWNWGYAVNDGLGNIIEHNHIHDIGMGYLSDMGGIYLLGAAPGTRVRNNVIHDITCRGYGGWAIYPDEGSTHLLIENNLAYRCNVAPFHQHFGRENVVRNNILAFGKKEQLAISRLEPHCSAIFERNLILLAEGKVFGTGYNWKEWHPHMAQWRNNLYWHQNGGALEFAGLDFAAWQKSGQDAGSLVADPGFADPANGDFTLRPGGPAESIGFVPFDFRDVGPRPDAAEEQ